MIFGALAVEVIIVERGEIIWSTNMDLPMGGGKLGKLGLVLV